MDRMAIWREYVLTGRRWVDDFLCNRVKNLTWVFLIVALWVVPQHVFAQNAFQQANPPSTIATGASINGRREREIRIGAEHARLTEAQRLREQVQQALNMAFQGHTVTVDGQPTLQNDGNYRIRVTLHRVPGPGGRGEVQLNPTQQYELTVRLYRLRQQGPDTYYYYAFGWPPARVASPELPLPLVSLISMSLTGVLLRLRGSAKAGRRDAKESTNGLTLTNQDVWAGAVQ